MGVELVQPPTLQPTLVQEPGVQALGQLTGSATHWNWGAQPGSGAVRVCRIGVAPLQPPVLQLTLVQAP